MSRIGMPRRSETPALSPYPPHRGRPVRAATARPSCPLLSPSANKCGLSSVGLAAAAHLNRDLNPQCSPQLGR